MIIIKGTEAACGVGTGNGSNFSNASAVRVFNSGTAVRTVSVEDASGNLIGRFSLAAKASEVVKKPTDHEIFASNAEVLAVAVGFTY